MEVGDIARVFQDFLTTNEGELCLKKGDIVQVFKKIDRHWCYGCSNGKVGNVALNHLILANVPVLDNDSELFAAIADFPAQQAGDLSFNAGELIVGLKKVDENWWQGTIDTTRVGIFPTTYTWQLDSTYIKKTWSPTVTNLKACVKIDMKAQLEEEMDLHKGEIITIIEVIDKDWYRGKCGNRSGIFPSTYVTILDESESMENEPQTNNFTLFDEPDKSRSLLQNDQDAYVTYRSSTSNFVGDNDLRMFKSGIKDNIQDNIQCDDLSILEDDYFKQNMPSMFKPDQNVPSTDSSNFSGVLYDCQPLNELDIIPYGITLYPFYAQFDNELSFHEGEIVNLIRHISKDWVEGKIDDRKGIFPSSYVNIIVDCELEPTPVVSNYNSSLEIQNSNNLIESDGITLETNSFAIVLYNFDMQMNSDLTVKEGEIVCIVSQVNQDWCEVKNLTGHVGLCPRNYVSPFVIPKKIGTDYISEGFQNNLYQPIIETSDLNRRNYEPHDFQEPNNVSHKSDNLDVFISKNLDNLQSMSSWSSQSGLNKTHSIDFHEDNQTPNIKDKNALEVPEDTSVSELKWNGDEVHNQTHTSPPHSPSLPQLPEAGDSEAELVENNSLPDASNEGHVVLNPCRSAPPVPDLQLRNVKQPVRQFTFDRVPHRPAPPIPLPGQKPVRRSISRRSCQKNMSDVSCFEQKMTNLRSIITAKENQLEYLKHAKEETLVKIESHQESSISCPVDETIQDMKYRVMKYDEKINFLTADLERLKGTVGENNVNISRRESCEMQMQPPNDSNSEATVGCAEEDRRKRNLDQRQNVISELVFTEKEYVRDLKITYETFHLHNPEFLESRGIDVQEVFGNMSEVMLLAEDFLDSLLLAMKGKEDSDQCIGPCFLELADRMKSEYGQYCMNHDAALTLLEKYEGNEDIQKIFSKGIETLRYQIVCFDMGSILIKPVQRILKYPLILNELIKCTEDSHKDKPELLNAVKTIMEVAAYINEYKRRKDIVSKYLEDGSATISSKVSRLSLHSVAKKSTRLSAFVTSSLGFGAVAKDPLFQELEVVFQSIEKTNRTFLKNVEIFLNHMHEVVVSQCQTAEAIAHFIQDKNEEAEDFCKIQKLIAKQFWKEFENAVSRRVTTPLNILLELFEGPGILIQKCHDKFLDYAACYTKAEKNKDIRLIQEELLNAKNNYEALNMHLLEELPTLITIASELFVECLSAFVTSKKLLSGKITKQYLYLLEKSQDKSLSDPLEVFAVKHSLTLNQLSRFSFLQKNMKSEPTTKRLSKNSPTVQTKESSLENMDQLPPTQSSSQRAYLQSQYSSNMLYHVTKSYIQNEPLELTLNEGYIVAAIKKQNPMGNASIWFVDDGVCKGFIPSQNLQPVTSSHVPSTSIMTNAVTSRHSSLSSVSTISRTSNDEATFADMTLPSYEEIKESPGFSNSQMHSPRSAPVSSRSQVEDEESNHHVYEEIRSENNTVYAEISEDLNQTAGKFYYSMYDFESNGANHILNIKRGQVVKVLQHQELQENSDWWFVEDRFGSQGFVPRNFLGKYAQE